MSKRKKLLIACPKCGKNIFVKRSLYKVSNHPLYIRKGGIVINYSKSVFTEHRSSKFWLRCLNPTCTYEQEFPDESALRSEVGLLSWDQIKLPKATPRMFNEINKPKGEILPTIEKAPTTESTYDPETNTLVVLTADSDNYD